ncbi:putative oxygenase MesX [Neotamlana laminarinivorans]|uniref:DUF1852 domain-containing protein n=1 Tax=Neotamlana laminarinivorans TaxID=2883124 RepID=A0A9X1I2D6_9FLAO|nr:putative oxygenase MesX [Tamlana laminarinivorans]MCB4798699.1 DUF1852 domain-containing protein [Tamlana laminarinivorans]
MKLVESREIDTNKKKGFKYSNNINKPKVSFNINKTFFNENYIPCSNTRTTTNFANLARGENREVNLRNTINMINNRFNSLAKWDNYNKDRYTVDLEIFSVDITINGNNNTFPTIEVLKTYINDHKTGKRLEGIVGNNFSSYIRDYDFSVLLPQYNKNKDHYGTPNNFGELHGNIFKCFVNSEIYGKHFTKSPVICLSVSSNKTYNRTGNYHPILGFEYKTNKSSLTEEYFYKMGLQVRYFMPPNSVAPLAFYFSEGLLENYTNLELISTISTMETFQKIYRPEIYNANSAAGLSYNASLKNQDYSVTKIIYDREERAKLGFAQGKFAEKNFIKPYKSFLEQWSANFSI